LNEVFYTAVVSVQHLHPTFLFDRFKRVMLFTNLHFSSVIQHSCMETKCSSCP